MTAYDVLRDACAGDVVADPRSTPETVTVPAREWHVALAALQAAGLGYLDFLTAVDREDSIEVVAHLAHLSATPHVLVATRVDRDAPLLASVVDLFAGAGWHERETHEMFGIEFEGNPDLRPLLTNAATPLHPLRKDTVLVTRQVRTWPGAAEDAANPSRRRQPAPGVVPGWGER